MLEILRIHPLVGSIALICIVCIARFLAKGYEARRNAHDKPGPPHSWIFGHVKEMATVAMSYPRRAHPHLMTSHIRKKYNLGSFFFLDNWPVAPPMIVICDPKVSQQLSVERNTLKHPTLVDFLTYIAGKDDMVSANGQSWQQWRRAFNPGFSTQHLMTLVPGIVDDVLVYVEKLAEYAQAKKVFRLEEDTTRLTVDIIGKVTLDVSFDMQRSDNPCVEAMREQVHLLPNEGMMNPFEMWNPYGMYRRWKNSQIMIDYIGKILDERFAASDSKGSKKQKKKRTIVDLALDSYVSGVEADLDKSPADAPSPRMDKKFRAGAITQIRTFLFAGHDTTSSTMCYIFYLLRKHPDCLEKIRQEHERVLGPAAGTADAIKAAPHLLNQLEYTLCVIKETLRLFPPASAPRIGEPDLTIRDPHTGEAFATHGYMLWLAHYSLHHHDAVWGPSVEAFQPERFLPANSHNIPEGAWRPFEAGPRNCLGQNLALLESRIILALTCRSFAFDLALDELAALRDDGSFWARNDAFRQGKQDVEGEELYQVLIGAAKPREGMPVRVRREEWTMG